MLQDDSFGESSFEGYELKQDDDEGCPYTTTAASADDCDGPNRVGVGSMVVGGSSRGGSRALSEELQSVGGPAIFSRASGPADIVKATSGASLVVGSNDRDHGGVQVLDGGISGGGSRSGSASLHGSNRNLPASILGSRLFEIETFLRELTTTADQADCLPWLEQCEPDFMGSFPRRYPVAAATTTNTADSATTNVSPLLSSTLDLSASSQKSGFLMTFGKGDYGKLGHGIRPARGNLSHVSAADRLSVDASLSHTPIDKNVGNFDNSERPTVVTALAGLGLRHINTFSTHGVAVTQVYSLYPGSI